LLNNFIFFFILEVILFALVIVFNWEIAKIVIIKDRGIIFSDSPNHSRFREFLGIKNPFHDFPIFIDLLFTSAQFFLWVQLRNHFDFPEIYYWKTKHKFD
jgi:hypothetical protein